jgi:hypothetical protein
VRLPRKQRLEIETQPDGIGAKKEARLERARLVSKNYREFLVMIVSVIVPAIVSSVLHIAAGRLVSVKVPSIIHIHDSMGPPIGMEAFVIVEAPETDRIAGDPNIAWPQIHIRATDDTDEFDAVPNVRVRNEDYRFGRNDDGRWCDHHGRRSDDNRLERDTPVRLNNTASN